MTEPGKKKIERMTVVLTDWCNRVEWTECQMTEIGTGDIFRAWNPSGDNSAWRPDIEPGLGSGVFVAVDDAALVKGATDGRCGVVCAAVNGFEAMGWDL